MRWTSPQSADPHLADQVRLTASSLGLDAAGVERCARAARWVPGDMEQRWAVAVAIYVGASLAGQGREHEPLARDLGLDAAAFEAVLQDALARMDITVILD